MKIGKTFHLVASIISIVATAAMLLPIADISGAVNMFQSAFGINCDSTWSNLVIFIIQMIMIIIDFIIIVTAISRYKGYDGIKFFRAVQLSLVTIMILLSFLTLAIIGLPSGAGISLGAGPIIFGIVNIIVIVFIVLSYIYLARKDNVVSNESINNVANKNKEIENLDLLLKYKELYDKKVITKQEFDNKKKELLK